ncbi:MAG TPA: c-type cytochrome [Geothrix sp.]|nr:c-type cytochrome [Geothrix sp.]
MPRTTPRLALLSALCLLPVQGLNGQDAEAQFRKSCMSCHTIGAGRKVGPDLKGLGQRRPHEWSARFLQLPSAQLDGGDPTAAALLREFNGTRMPDLGVTAAEAQALLKLIDDYTAAGKTLGTAAISRPATPEDIRQGQQLFLGLTRFASGAPSCLSCHSAQGLGGFGGGRLGPDLTGASGKLGVGLVSAIENPAFPTMQGVFQKTPLTGEEAFRVGSFLKSISSQPPARTDMVFPVLGIVGLVSGMLVGGRLGRKRLRGVRRNLKPRA